MKNWRALHAVIMQLHESACMELLVKEMRGLRRNSIMARLHGRYNTLRARRERIDFGITKEAT